MTTRPSPNLLRASVDLADWLANSTETERDTFARLLDQIKPGLVDQLDAAATHARIALPHTTVDAGPAHGIPPGQAPEWLQLSIAEAATLYAAGQAETCIHADPNRPEPVFAAAWKPGLVTCLRCMHLFRCTSGEDDRRCDQCGTVDREVYPCRIASGHLIYAWGLCPGCVGGWAEMLGVQV